MSTPATDRAILTAIESLRTLLATPTPTVAPPTPALVEYAGNMPRQMAAAWADHAMNGDRRPVRQLSSGVWVDAKGVFTKAPGKQPKATVRVRADVATVEMPQRNGTQDGGLRWKDLSAEQQAASRAQRAAAQQSSAQGFVADFRAGRIGYETALLAVKSQLGFAKAQALLA